MIDAVRKTKVSNGITGSFEILPSGDPSVGPITVSVAKEDFVPVKSSSPAPRAWSRPPARAEPPP